MPMSETEAFFELPMKILLYYHQSNDEEVKETLEFRRFQAFK